ncbi:arrestin 3a, retinal (X-arrestin) [Neoarius graeffei]|uniref:arrestin 3a, retinal (X-arrestin) n=1 Tax=Neoarius graeffei TaxID=443677 RepID=UPI00298C28ED|nr:arrestin 3a, retinal (X-arrestin) [Neoarius graeffei]
MSKKENWGNKNLGKLWNTQKSPVWNILQVNRVFKKTSGNGQLTLYLGKRDYIDNVDSVEPVEGVVKLDPKDLGDRKVWVQLCCAFRYGNEDLDVIGLIFRKDIWIHRIQIYPEAEHKPKLTDMHNILLKKAGEQAYAFTFDIPTNLPCSITLQPGPDDQEKKPCGVDFEVKAYVAKEADNPDEKISKKDTCRLIIRKSQFAPLNTGAGQRAELCKSFMLSDKSLLLEASVEKDIYYHGETIPVKVKVKNDTNKVVNKFRITIDQTTDVVLYSADKYVKTVLKEDFEETVEANSMCEKVFRVTPLLAQNREKRGLAVDGKLKYEDTNLASTTILKPGMDREILGIMVFYKITVHLLVSGGGLLGGLTGSDVVVELPLTLMQPKPTA